MSVLVDGVSCATVGRGFALDSYFSPGFFAARFPGLNPLRPLSVVVTLVTAARGSFSTALPCRVDPQQIDDLVLGLRWKTFVREWLLAAGESVPSAFDPWTLFLGTGSMLFLLCGLRLPHRIF